MGFLKKILDLKECDMKRLIVNAMSTDINIDMDHDAAKRTSGNRLKEVCQSFGGTR